ncbi:ABC transporter permease subunit [Pyrobaculum calidifontis]|uniref:Binding-protein-dependent transport systems inner membrane component n=1 Tax=Pyrobaculum calidifontis (strain DSM 21063 / JCM 11548 / VA1) TaxID=410359 RepID=A3MTY7_PYRCJ|nr:ABC transporter permease subunit [Pyrobaculum calidifontis]ABO08104.1 binding-protein-dependent transport systems inner membrane component [Pyrobaculum calidifontis JCM 11548]
MESLVVSFLALLATYARMALGLVVSIAVAYALGYAMAKSRRAEAVLLPFLDVMQSVPILGFFPVALFVFVSFFPRIGAELAAVFLIFTSMAWNIIFGVYQALKTLPREYLEMARLYLNERLEIAHVVIPFTLRSLYYNAAISWANAFFFITASEVITLGTEIHLFGIGSLVVKAFEDGDLATAYVGIAVALLGNVALYALVWRRVLTRLPQLPFVDLWRVWMKYGAYVVYAAILLLAYLFAEYVATAPLSAGGFAAAVAESTYLSLFSLARVLAVILISAAVGLATTALVVEKPSREVAVFPAVAVLSSIPPVFLYPLLAAFIKGEILVLVLLLPAAALYTVINTLAAWRDVPRDLAKAYQISGWLYLWHILIPAALPYIATGLLTTWGGAWNGLVVAEPFADVSGLGSYMAHAAGRGDVNALFASVAVMTAIVVATNRLLWRRLYRLASQWA